MVLLPSIHVEAIAEPHRIDDDDVDIGEGRLGSQHVVGHVGDQDLALWVLSLYGIEGDEDLLLDEVEDVAIVGHRSQGLWWCWQR